MANQQAYKNIPLKPEQIKELKKNPLWNEVIQQYGEENVINNYLVDYVILQEEKDIYDKSGKKITVTADLIRKVYSANVSMYEKFIEAPINKLKSWVQESPDLVGHVPIYQRNDELSKLYSDTPIITDHQDPNMSDKKGIILSGSYKLLTLPDKDGKNKLHLLCQGLLISPDAKWGYVSNNWIQVSPTILTSYKISELSYVPYSAQMNNSSLSSGELPLINNDVINATNYIAPVASFDISELDAKLQLISKKVELEKLNNAIKQKESIANAHVDNLINNGIITSGQRRKTTEAFMQLSNGEEPLVANLLKQISKRKSPLSNKPQRLFLQGAIEMSTQAERYQKFRENNPHFKTALELNMAFRESEKVHQESLSLASGEVKLEDKASKLNEILSLLETDEEIDGEIKDRLMSLCSKKFGMKLSDNSPGGTVDAGGVMQPNNTNLSGGETPLETSAQNEQIEVLTQCYETLKSELNKKNVQFEDLKAQFEKFKVPATVESVKPIEEPVIPNTSKGEEQNVNND